MNVKTKAIRSLQSQIGVESRFLIEVRDAVQVLEDLGYHQSLDPSEFNQWLRLKMKSVSQADLVASLNNKAKGESHESRIKL